MSEIRMCKTLLPVKYRWVGATLMVTWLVCVQWLVAWLGIGTYFAIYIVILLSNAFFTITNCLEVDRVFWSIVPYLVPVIGIVMFMIATNSASLQLLMAVDVADADRASDEGSYVMENLWLLAYTETMQVGTPTVDWQYFVGVMIVGFIMYAWSDASDNDGLKGLSAMVIIVPIAIEIWLGFQYGRSYGILGTYMNEAFHYLPEIGNYVSVLTGSILEFMLASVFFSVEHMIMEEENL